MPQAMTHQMRVEKPSHKACVKGTVALLKKREYYSASICPNFHILLSKAGFLKRIPAFFFPIFSKITFVKTLAGVLSISIFLTSLTPSVLQAQDAVQMQRQRVQMLGGGLSASVEDAFVRAYEKNRPFIQRGLAAEAIVKEEAYHLGNATRLAENCEEALYEAGLWKSDNLGMKYIEKGGTRYPAVAYGQACAALALDLTWDGKGEVVNEVSRYGGKFTGSSLAVNRLISVVGVGEEGVEKAFRYAEKILADDKVCLKGDKAGSDRQAQQGRCEAALEALESVAVLSMMYPRYKQAAADVIFSFIDSRKRNVHGVAGAYKGALLLMGLNTDYSYELLGKFLLGNGSRPTVGGTALEALDHTFIEGTLKTGQEALGGGRYLNIYTEQYSYPDYKQAERWGMKECSSASAVEASGKKDKELQCPMGNLYEDLGQALAADYQNERSAKLAEKIFKEGLDYHIGGRYARPLWVGVLTGGYGAWAYAHGGRAVLELKNLRQANFNDLNEGTLRRLRMKASAAVQYHAGDARSKQVAALMEEKYYPRDDAKYEQYLHQQTLREKARVADWLLIVLSGMELIGRGSVGFVRHVRGIEGVLRDSGGAVEVVSARNVAVGAKTAVQEAKTFTQVKKSVQAATKAVQQESKAAAKQLQASGGHAPVYNKAAVGQQVANTAKQSAQVEQAASTASSAAKIPAKYQKGMVTNFLGQQVEAWVPTTKEAQRLAASKAARQAALSASRQVPAGVRFNGFTSSVRELGQSLKHSTLGMVIAAQMTLAPMMPGFAALSPRLLGQAAKAGTELVLKAAPKTGIKLVSVNRTASTVAKAAVQTGSRVTAASKTAAVATQAARGARGIGVGSFFLPVGVGRELFVVPGAGGYRRDISSGSRIQNAQQLAKQYDQQQAFKQYESWKQNRALSQSTLRLQYQRQGLPVVGNIYNAWNSIGDNIYSQVIAPVRFLRNPYYQASQKAQTTTTETVAPTVHKLTIEPEKIDSWVRSLPRTSGVAAMNGLGDWVDRNNFRREVRQVVEQAAKEAEVVYNALPASEQTVAQKRALIQEAVADKLANSTTLTENEKSTLQDQLVTLLDQEFGTQAAASVTTAATKTSKRQIANSLSNKKPEIHSKTFRRILAQSRKRSIVAFVNSDTKADNALRKNARFMNIWRTDVAARIRKSNLPSSLKEQFLQNIYESTKQFKPASSESITDYKIAVYNSNHEHVASWNLGKDAPVLKTNQRAYIQLDEYKNTAEMFVVDYEKRNADGIAETTLVRSDIPVFGSEKKKTSSFGLRKVIEGLLLVNNKVWPMFGIYLLAGMGNVSSTISTFTKATFEMSGFELFMMGGLSSISMGIVSILAGILQNRWSHDKDGRINGKRGRTISMNIGLVAFIVSFILPMLGGMFYHVGDPVIYKKYLLMASFLLLGFGAAFLDVSMKPTVMAATMSGEYLARQGYLSVFKQTVGNVSNYVVPPIAMMVTKWLGNVCDWSIYFPIYTVAAVGVLVMFNAVNMHQQTMEENEFVAKENRLSVGKIWKEIVGSKPYNRILRHGVLATALQGANMGILGLYINNMFREHYATTVAGAESNWLIHSFAAFTLPIIAGRFIGTYLMKHDIKIGNKLIKRLNNGSLLQVSALATIISLAGILMNYWPIQVAGVVLAALGLTNISPIVNGYTTHQTRHVSDAVSALLSATSLISFLVNLAFGHLLDITCTPIAFLLPVGMLSYLFFFGRDIRTHRLETEKGFTAIPGVDDDRVSIESNVYEPGADNAWVEELKELSKDIPVRALQNKLFVGFRGMHGLGLKDIEYILKNGLEREKTKFNSIFFSNKLLGNYTPSEFKKLLKKEDFNQIVSRGSLPLIYAGGPIPVLIGLKPGAGNYEAGTDDSYMRFYRDMGADEIVVFAFMQHKGKNGWYQVSLSENNTLSMLPVKQYVRESLWKLQKQKALHFVRAHKAWFWAGAGLAGLGLSWWLGTGVSGLLLGVMPLLMPKSSKPSDVSTTNDLSKTYQAVMPTKGHLVWKLLDEDENALGYVKYASERELTRAKLFEEIMKDMSMDTYNLLDIEYPRILAEGLQVLPLKIQQKILMTKSALSVFGNIRDFETRSEVAFIMSALNLQGLTLRQVMERPELMPLIMRQQEMSLAEWEQICAFFDALHEKGFKHTDLLNNLYMGRDASGKLHLTLLDFEDFDGNPDDKVLDYWRKELMRHELFEYRVADANMWKEAEERELYGFTY